MFSQIKRNKLKLCINSEGAMVISGRSVDLNNQEYYDDLISKCRLLSLPILSGTINLEYLNCASFRKIYELLETIEKNDSILEAFISFFVDGDDEDLQELWSLIPDNLPKIQYKMYAKEMV